MKNAEIWSLKWTTKMTMTMTMAGIALQQQAVAVLDRIFPEDEGDEENGDSE